jgi:hypothetical protein
MNGVMLTTASTPIIDPTATNLFFFERFFFFSIRDFGVVEVFFLSVAPFEPQLGQIPLASFNFPPQFVQKVM